MTNHATIRCIWNKFLMVTDLQVANEVPRNAPTPIASVSWSIVWPRAGCVRTIVGEGDILTNLLQDVQIKDTC